MTQTDTDEVNQRKQRINGIFSRAAPTYDQVGPRFFSHFGEGLVEIARIQPGARVLDVATGRGSVLFPAARAVGDSGQVIGTDLSEAMVNATNQEIHRRKIKNIMVEQMDAESLQFADASFDCVLCGFALFFFPRLEHALAEMRRVLKPGGCLAVTTWEEYEDQRWTWYDELAKSFLPPPEAAAPTSPSKPPGPDLETKKGMRAVMKTAGFHNVECKSEKFEVTYHTEDEWWTTQWSHGGRALLEEIESALGVEGLERFKQAVFEGLRKMKQTGGITTAWPALFTVARKP